jgi:predicted lipoprotein with Yx(FWY)xxD motif
MALYIFTNDTADAGTSVCNGECATNWPPLLQPDGATVAGPAGATGTFGTATRDDGATQVTYKGMPLYYYAGDSAAGDTNGHEVGGVWFLAAP